jgi:transposase
LSRQELQRLEVLSRVQSEELRLADAAVLMKVSYRQAKRLWARYQSGGAEALKHGNAGRKSNRAKPAKLRKRVLGLIRRKYSGEKDKRFGPTLAAEHLSSEDGIEIDAETLRRWMLADGLWSRARKRKPYRQQRKRRAHFGELVQMDGSFHEWLEERGPRGCLMNMVDDATSTTMAMFSREETTWAAANILRLWIERYGVPRALYTDWKNVYKRKPTPKEELDGTVPVTQFGRMCARLDIEMIAAGSAQAKGRVERNHGTHQDRLIKKLRRKRICDYEAANAFLDDEYLGEHNDRFAVAAEASEDYHRNPPGRLELREVFRLEQERTLSNSWVVRYEGRWFQLDRQTEHYAPAKAKVTVCEWQDGTLEIRYRDRKLSYRELDGPPTPKAEPKPAVQKQQRPTGPTPEHPWKKQGFGGMKPRVLARAEIQLPAIPVVVS